jgi:triphosphoribosyl-dephospho-CoA synthase
MLSIGLCAQLACIWEATARKPGNVHRYRDFDDTGYIDFLLAAAAIAPVLESAATKRVGQTVLEAVRATRQAVATNANLGIVLLLAPLASVPQAANLRADLTARLSQLDVEDARLVYDAIRLARPGGLGRVAEEDIRDEPTKSLQEIMRLAADRDLIARQYVNGYREVFELGAPCVVRELEQARSLEQAIIACHLNLLASFPDSLIARKRSPAEAAEASRRARCVLDEGWPVTKGAATALEEFDGWLRSEGHARNPGTTADLVAACLFVLLRQGSIQLPCSF